MKSKKSLWLALALLLWGCHKEEIPVPKHDTGDATEVQIAMGSDYKNQLFYNLENNVIISSNDKIDWDLAFESSATGAHIILNSSRGMAVHRSLQAFNALTDHSGLSWNWDAPSGDLDSTAIGDWENDQLLYVIDMGYNADGLHQGYIKMKPVSVSANTYMIEYGDIADLSPQTISVTKNTNNLFSYFKFGTGNVTIAPSNESWDLLFTQYTHLFYDPDEAYVVTGVLLNRYNTAATRIMDKPFETVTYDDIAALTFSSDINYIGYDWKYFDFANSIYTVDPTITYIVQTSSGYYYKLHFIDFYNTQGEKGYPKLEVQQM